MPDPDNPLPLDYRRPPDGRRRYVESPEEKRWRHYRLLFRLGLFAVIAPGIVYCLPHYLLFGKLGPLRLADFVPLVQGDPTKTVIAIKEYQRDTGNLPNSIQDLEPKYLPKGDQYFGEMYGGQYGYICDRRYYPHMITYDFTSGAGHWGVHGPIVNGAIPLPPVTLSPPTHPATHP
ncbi:MAG TPA: hypothetical protein VHY37_09615 [Tepidisphaeraceae bacterium]|jgi:hypothetical protein|nr:hypothetical protein [Tepidisphaeraceae bacterium]